ncbi:MAG: hypothetical protein OXC61_09485 [Flavobacteriaceae bacterium]|nr:hypothetical protein [Flavobacteriaceae bacterium]
MIPTFVFGFFMLTFNIPFWELIRFKFKRDRELEVYLPRQQLKIVSLKSKTLRPFYFGSHRLVVSHETIKAESKEGIKNLVVSYVNTLDKRMISKFLLVGIFIALMSHIVTFVTYDYVMKEISINKHLAIGIIFGMVYGFSIGLLKKLFR